jgi:uncharacterized membrane protein
MSRETVLEWLGRALLALPFLLISLGHFTFHEAMVKMVPTSLPRAAGKCTCRNTIEGGGER